MNRRITISSRLLIGSIAILFAFMTFGAQAGEAASAEKPKWIYPAIKDFGGVHPRTDVAVFPDPKAEYKIFVDVTTAHKDKKGNYYALNRLARIVNLMAFAKVPPEHVHIVALLDGETVYAALTNEYFRKKFDMDNPNLALLRAVKKAGVEILICSQAMAGMGLPDKAIDPSVTVSLSALTDAIVYGHKGYSYMQL